MTCISTHGSREGGKSPLLFSPSFKSTALPVESRSRCWRSPCGYIYIICICVVGLCVCVAVWHRLWIVWIQLESSQLMPSSQSC